MTPIEKKMARVFLIVLLLFDTTFAIIRFNQYDVVIFHTNSWNIPILLNVLLFVIIMLVSKKWVIWIPIIILIIYLFVFRLGYLLMNWDYHYLVSPKGTETLIIKHRVASLGESNYFYAFYEKSYHGILMKKIDVSDLRIMVRDHDRYPNAEKALGFDHPNWLNEKKVIFDSKDGQKEVTLN